MRILALYDIHGNVDADERFVRGALIEPVEPKTVTRIFEQIAAG